ncbi:MAG: Spy/CpxP family protein refolding chaperone [Halarcobacter sp.]
MKTTKVLVAVAITGLLSTGLYAACNGQGMMHKGMNNSMNNGTNCNMNNSNKMMKQKGQKRGNKGPLSILRQLNLTVEQRQQIIDIRSDLMKNRVTPDVAFTKDGFDKAKFIEIMKQKRENMIESKAEMIDRVYKILTVQQKEQFKVLMDLKREKRMNMMNYMNKGMNFDTNCNGRR